MATEHLENCGALMPLQLHDAGSEPPVHKGQLPACDRMRSDHRVFRTGKHFASILDAVASAEDVLAVMNGRQPLEQLAHGLRERVVRQIHVSKHGISAT